MSCSSAARFSHRRRSSGTPEFLGDHVGEQGHTLAVAAGEGTLGVDDLREGRGDIVEIFLIDRGLVPRRLQRENPALDIRCRKLVPEFRPRGDPGEGAHQLRIEPGAGRGVPTSRIAASRSELVLQHVDHLRHQRDARIERNFDAAQSVRQAAAVPVLVEILDALRDRLAEPHLARDVGAALAARLDQFAGDIAAILEDVDQRAKSFGQAGLQSGMGEHEAKRLRQAAVDLLEVVFELDVVGQIELADPRGIAAAAQILQQQRVVQFPQLEFAEPELAGRSACRSSSSARNARPAGLRSCRARGSARPAIRRGGCHRRARRGSVATNSCHDIGSAAPARRRLTEPRASVGHNLIKVAIRTVTAPPRPALHRFADLVQHLRVLDRRRHGPGSRRRRSSSWCRAGSCRNASSAAAAP